MSPAIAPATAARLEGRTAMTHALETQLISGMFSRMQMAITGKD